MHNDFEKVLSKVLPHVIIDLSLVFMVFLVLNKFNPMMGFLSNKYSQALLWVLCVCALAESILLIIFSRRENK